MSNKLRIINIGDKIKQGVYENLTYLATINDDIYINKKYLTNLLNRPI